MSNQFIAQCIGEANSAVANGQYAVAIECCQRLVRKFPSLPEAWYNLSIAFRGQGKREQALNALKKTDGLTRENSDAQNSIGFQFMELGALLDAERCLRRAISLAPDFAFAYSNLGMLREKQGRLDDAEALFNKAVELQPNLAPAYANLCCVQLLKNRHESAEASARKAVEVDPNFSKAWTSLAVALCGLKDIASAETAACAAIKLDPASSEAWLNYCGVLSLQRRYVSAEEAVRKAIELAPLSAVAWRKLGQVLVEQKQYKAAADCFAKSLVYDPLAEDVQGEIVRTRMQICEWSTFAADLELISRHVHQGRCISAATPFAILALKDDLAIHLKAASRYAAEQYPENSPVGEISEPSCHERIRIGYYSADFHNHATSYLMVELFELHDKSRFELIGFSFGPDSQDEMRQRVSAAFDQFIDVSQRSDRDVALMSREMGVDIAVDLKGYTQDCRPGIFSCRAAPVQVNYLGFPGTMGANFIDYIVADRTLIPAESQAYYSEKVVYLPNSYQVNDANRQISSRNFTRSEVGLPDFGFVFACFNNNYKITPDVFASWMRILKRVPHSVLWLFETNPDAVRNLRKNAEVHGVDAGRLVFANSLPLDEHLSRIRLADLFLDTLPYNAHTTTSDALWAGLPVLTRMGASFASRVAASLLRAVDVPELIASTQQDYENLASELASDPERLGAIKQRLVESRNSTPLFDSTLFTRHLEAAYSAMCERYHSGLPPEHIYVDAGAAS